MVKYKTFYDQQKQTVQRVIREQHPYLRLVMDLCI